MLKITKNNCCKNLNKHIKKQCFLIKCFKCAIRLVITVCLRDNEGEMSVYIKKINERILEMIVIT